MTEQPTPSTNPNFVDSLLHPQAILIRQLLTRTGRIELSRILIDDEENILQALNSGVELESVYCAGDEIVSDELKKKLSPNVNIYEVAKRTTKKIFENDKITRIFAIAKTPKPIELDAITKIQRDMVVLEDVSISGNIGAITRTSLALGVGGIVLLNTEQNLYQMWYSALGIKASKIAFRVGYATSVDGLTWARSAGPVLEPDQEGAWDSAVVSHANVVHAPSSGYHLFYFGTSEENHQHAEQNGAAMIPGSIGHAFSEDGLSWEKDANPVLSTVPNSWEAWMVGGPSALIQDNQVKLWYFGSAVHSTYEFHLGFATSKLP